MSVQEQLAAFDGWLTGRIEEAHAAHKDLAFRDLEAGAAECAASWEYSLLDPGQIAPSGEGWSVYRLQGVWPEFLRAAADAGERQSLFADMIQAVFPADAAKAR